LRAEVAMRTSSGRDGARQAGTENPAPHEQLDALQDQVAALAESVRAIHDLLAGHQKSHYTVEEVAALTGRAPYTVRTWVRDGIVEAIRVHGTGPRGRLLGPREQLCRLVEGGSAAGSPASPPAGRRSEPGDRRHP
jgi:hypothetical protein